MGFRKLLVYWVNRCLSTRRQEKGIQKKRRLKYTKAKLAKHFVQLSLREGKKTLLLLPKPYVTLFLAFRLQASTFRDITEFLRDSLDT